MRSLLWFCLGLFVICVLAQNSDVVILTDANFDEHLKKGNWLLEFYAPWCGHCKNLAPTYENVATELKGKVNVGKIDCTTETAIANRFGIRGYPTIKYFTASDKKVWDYQGDRSLDSFVKFCQENWNTASSSDFPAPAVAAQPPVESTGSESDVVILTESNFNDKTSKGNWLVEFYAPWCGHCKHLAPTYEKLATQLKGKVNVGKIDCTIEQAIARRFSIRGFPTLKYLVNGKLYDYRGDRSLDDFVQFTSEGYKTVDGSDLPTGPTEFQAFADELGSVLIFIEKSLASHIWITITTVFVLGLVTGKFILSSSYSSTSHQVSLGKQE